MHSLLSDGLTIESAASDYLNHLRFERMSARSTVYTYASWLTSFRKWLTENGHPDAGISILTTDILRAYQYSMSSRRLRPRTIRAAFYPIRSLSCFLMQKGILAENPCTPLTMPRMDAAIRLLISQKEVVALIENLDRLHPLRRATLAKAMLSVMVFSGLRCQEVLDLRVSDVNIADKTLLVASGKGSKSRLLYPPPNCLDTIADWLEIRDDGKRRKTTPATDWLWADHAGRRIGEAAFRVLLEEMKAAAGLREHNNIKPHSLRHFFATMLDKNGAPLKVMQAALGHSSIQTTLIYLHNSEKDTQRMADFSKLLQPPAPEPVPAAPVIPPDVQRKMVRRNAFQQARRGQR